MLMNGTTETGAPASDREWSWWLKVVGVIGVAPVGIVGCIMTLIVFTRRRSLKSTSFSVYLRTQCVVDGLILIQQAFFKVADLVWYLSAGTVSLVDWQDKYACQITEFLKRSMYMITVWMTLCFCVDRYLALRFPLSTRTAAFRTPRTARILTATICVALPLVESYYFFTMTKAESASAEGRVCVVVDDAALRKVHAIMDNFVHMFLLAAGGPIVGIVILNVLTIRAIRKQAEDMPKSKVSQKLNKVMIGVSLFYVAVSLPYIVVALVGIGYPSSRDKPLAYWHVLYVADILSKLFFMSNFVVYSVMRKQFHEELIRQWCCCLHWRLQPGSGRTSNKSTYSKSSSNPSSTKDTSTAF